MQGTIEAPATASESKTRASTDAAFEALYRTSRDDVYAYVAGVLRDRSAAEEVTAQAFERALRRSASFDPDRGSRRAWLFGIARNAALDELRRRGRQAELAGEFADEAAEDPAASPERVALRATVRAAISTLTARERELVALKFFAGLSNAEIAAVLGTTESNAGTKVHRTITKLRQACDA